MGRELITEQGKEEVLKELTTLSSPQETLEIQMLLFVDLKSTTNPKCTKLRNGGHTKLNIFFLT